MSMKGFMYDAFLSHKQSTGGDFAARIKLDLERLHKGLRCFLDVDDLSSIHLLEEKIQQSKCFVLLITDGVLESEYVRQEIQWAVEMNKPFILIHKNGSKFPNIIKEEKYIQKVFSEKAIPFIAEKDFRDLALRKLIDKIAMAYVLNSNQERGDWKKAGEFFESACAHTDSVIARFMLGFLLYFGSQFGLKGDRARAEKLMGEAADRKHRLAVAFCDYLGLAGHKARENEAVEEFRDLAYNGDVMGQNFLGFAYDNGKGCERDYGQALEWFKRSASQGYASAQYNVGRHYEQGLSGPVDQDKAFEWYMKAAIQGQGSAMTQVGYLLAVGRGCPKNVPEGLKWLKRASDQGVDRATKLYDQLK